MGNEEQVKAQLAAIEKAKEIRNVAISDGEMAIAEEQFSIKAQLLEHLEDMDTQPSTSETDIKLVPLAERGAAPSLALAEENTTAVVCSKDTVAGIVEQRQQQQQQQQETGEPRKEQVPPPATT